MMTDTLYDHDFGVWADEQAEHLRRAAREGSNLPLDWDHLAEEIETLGSETRHKVESLANLVLVHLLKLACSPAEAPRAGWKDETDEYRDQLNRVLRRNHNLSAKLPEILRDEWPSALRKASRSLRRQGEAEAARAVVTWQDRPFDAADVLTDGLFPEAGTGHLVREEP